MKIRMTSAADYRFRGRGTGYAVRAYKAGRVYVVTREIGDDLIARKVAEPVEQPAKKET